MRKIIIGTFLLIGFFPALTLAFWSEDAHNHLIETAFPNESLECISQMQEGSKSIDALKYQLGGKSYLHAMRNGSILAGPPYVMEGKKVRESKKKMTEFINNQYLDACDLLVNRRPLEACYSRGRALHPVMDATSPSHRGFQDWFLGDLSQLHKHGDFPGSEETLEKLIEDQEVLYETTEKMVRVDELGLKCDLYPFVTEDDLF